VKLIRDRAGMQRAARAERLAGRRIGFVPTMGAFHEGHLSLMRSARAAVDVIVVSVFVNPLQFGPDDDFHRYPRDEERDLELARREGVDILFAPSAVEEMYPPGHSTTVGVGRLGEVLEGEVREGHFQGVCTVVAELFNIVEPDVAFFGQKDAQQVAVVKRMVADLFFGAEIVVCPTVREQDGLAMSSRNRYLDDGQRRHATCLIRALRAGRELIEGGAGIDVVEKEMWDVMRAEEGVDPDYARAVDPDTFDAPRPGGPIVLAVAGRVGPARLIDNLLLEAV
jgi:pantoate--beta-alanine ligase